MTTKKKANPQPKRRPPYVPTPEDTAKVQALCGFGLAEKDVAAYIDISVPTLRKYFSEKMRKARPNLMAMAAGGLFDALKNKEAWAVKWVHATIGKEFGWHVARQSELEPDVTLEDVFPGADFNRLNPKQMRTMLDLLALCGVFLTERLPPAALPMRELQDAGGV